MWVELRHKHITDAIQFTSQNLDLFTKNNRAAKFTLKNKATNVVLSDHVAKTTREIGQIIHSIPQYQDLINKYSLHIHLIQECMDIFKKHDLDSLTTLEQDIVCGYYHDGNKTKMNHIFARATSFLKIPE